MTSRYTFVARAYPTEYRKAHGAELVLTANELSPNGWSLRQSRSLLLEGLRTRAKLSSNGSSAQTWGNGIAVALGLKFVLAAAVPLPHLLGMGQSENFLRTNSPWPSVLLALLPLVALTFSTRWPTALVITGLNTTRVVSAAQGDATLAEFMIESGFALLAATTALAWWLAIRTDGRRAFSPAVGLLLIFVATGMSAAIVSPNFHPVAVVILCGPPIVGLALVSIDPRPLIVATIFYALTTASLVSGLAVSTGGEALTSSSEGTIAISLATLCGTAMLSRFGTRRLLTR